MEDWEKERQVWENVMESHMEVTARRIQWIVKKLIVEEEFMEEEDVEMETEEMEMETEKVKVTEGVTESEKVTEGAEMETEE